MLSPIGGGKGEELVKQIISSNPPPLIPPPVEDTWCVFAKCLKQSRASNNKLPDTFIPKPKTV